MGLLRSVLVRNALFLKAGRCCLANGHDRMVINSPSNNNNQKESIVFVIQLLLLCLFQRKKENKSTTIT